MVTINVFNVIHAKTTLSMTVITKIPSLNVYADVFHLEGIGIDVVGKTINVSKDIND